MSTPIPMAAISAMAASRALNEMPAPRGNWFTPSTSSSRIPPAPIIRPRTPPTKASKTVSCHYQPHDMSPSCSERLANSQLAGARAGPNEKQIDEIDCADGQQQENCSLQQDQNWPDSGHIIGMQRRNNRPKA